MKKSRAFTVPPTRAAVVFLYRVTYETYRQLCRKENPTEKEVAVIAHYKEQLKAAQVCIKGDLGLRGRVEFADLDAAAEVPPAGGARFDRRAFLDRARRYLAGEPGAGDMDPSAARLAVAVAERAEGPGAAAGGQVEAQAPLILQAEDTGPGAARIASAMAKYSAGPQDPGSSPEARRAALHIARPEDKGEATGAPTAGRAVLPAPPKPRARPPRAPTAGRAVLPAPPKPKARPPRARRSGLCRGAKAAQADAPKKKNKPVKE